MSRPAAPSSRAIEQGAQDWRVLLLVFSVTSLVEGLGVSQIFAFVPSYLSSMGVPESERLSFVGLFGSLMFVVGAPLVPLWGVWADKYSRKAIIVRSSIVEAIVFAAVAASRTPEQLALSMLLVGFQLGNTGVMLAAIRDSAPSRRLGSAVALYGAASPVGFAIGPYLGGLMIDGLGLSISAVFALSAVLSVGTALLVAFGSREVRPEHVPEGQVLTLAFGAVRNVLTDPAVRRIFLIFGVAFLANQMSRPYQPVLVEGLVPADAGRASAIGFVTGTAALVGAFATPFGGVLGDRLGFRRVLVLAMAGGALAQLAAPAAPTVPLLALVVVGIVAANGIVSAMVFAILATDVPAERRSATLNLVYLPLYAAGIVGPALAGGIASVAGPSGPFLAGATVFFAATVVLLIRGATARPEPRRATGTADADERR